MPTESELDENEKFLHYLADKYKHRNINQKDARNDALDYAILQIKIAKSSRGLITEDELSENGEPKTRDFAEAEEERWTNAIKEANEGSFSVIKNLLLELGNVFDSKHEEDETEIKQGKAFRNLANSI